MPTASSDKKPYVIYTRRSTDDTKNQKNSLAYQIEQSLSLAREAQLPMSQLSKQGFCENGVIKEKHSAFKTSSIEVMKDGSIRYRIERPKFQELVKRLASGEFAGVIALCLDRLSRNKHDAAIIDDLIAAGVDVRFVQVEYERNSSGSFHRDIDGAVAAIESRRSAERIRNIYGQLIRSGKCPYRSPIGYLDKGPKDKPIDPVRAPIVKRMFDLYATGEWSMTELARWANSQGLTTKPSRPYRTMEELLDADDADEDEEDDRAAVCRPIRAKTLEGVLKNPFYIGQLRFKDEIVPGNHEPLIDGKLFQRVQDALRARNRSVHYVEKGFATYRGLLRCVCGRGHSPYEKKGHMYYRPNCKPDCRSENANVSEKRIHELVVNLLERLSLTPEEKAHLEAKAPDFLGGKERQREERERDRERRRVETDRDLAYLSENRVTLLREGVYRPEEYRDEVLRLKTRIEEIRREQETEAVSDEKKLETILSLFELVKLAEESYLYATDTEKRLLMTSALFELVVQERNLANVRAKAGFAAMLKRHDAKFGGPRWTRTICLRNVNATL